MRAADAFGDVLAGHLRHARRRPRCPRRHGRRRSRAPPTGSRRSCGSSAWRRWRWCCRASDRTATPPCAPPAPPRAAAAAACAPILSAPMRLISVSRPGSFAGFSVSIMRSRSSGSCVGPTFMPSGFFTPRRNSTCAPSGWRVRSPIHRKCAEQPYQSPVVELIAGQRLLVGQQQRLVADVEIGLAHVARGGAGHAAGGHEGQRLVDPRAPGPGSARPAASARRSPGSSDAPRAGRHSRRRRRRAAGSACRRTGNSRTPSAPDRGCAPRR